MIVEGQVHGGIAQGIGQALLEGAVYDEPASSSPASSWTTPCRAPTTCRRSRSRTPHAVPGQSARRQGLRRGRRDRRAGGRDQRDHRCDRQQQAGNAGDARSRLARHPRLREGEEHVRDQLSPRPPPSTKRRRCLPRARSQISRRRPHAAAGDEAAAGLALRCDRSRQDQGAGRDRSLRRHTHIKAATTTSTSCKARTCKKAIPALAS